MQKRYWFALLISWLLPKSSFASWQMNMPYGVTPTSHAIYTLHMIGFWVCAGIAIIVFSVMAYAIIFHRKSRGVKAAKFHEHSKLELIWAIIPFIILIFLAVPATKILIKMHDTSLAKLTIKVTGYQWKWHYDYLDYHVSFFSNLATPLKEIKGEQIKNPNYLREVDNPLIVPIHTKIRILTTSNDVIHSWWVSPLGVKKDAIPGFINEAWMTIEKPGTYRGQCAELCGMNHGYMPIVVIAKTPSEFTAWITSQAQKQKAAKAQSEQKFTLQQLSGMGEKTYLKICAACHQPNGQGLPPTFPALAKSPTVTGELSKHIETVLNGRPGTAMQAFREQLTATELAAVITYERNAFGNNTHDIVQPDMIEQYKKNGGLAKTVSGSTLPQGNSPVDEASKALFIHYCSGCHLPDTLDALSKKTKEQQIKATLQGTPQGMPAFNSWLTPAQIAAVLNYLNNNEKAHSHLHFSKEELEASQGHPS